MIYITVGNNPFGFDDLIKTIDNFDNIEKYSFYAQIGNGFYKPRNIKFKKFLTTNIHEKLIKESSLVISHGGLGTILDLIKLKKKFLIVPQKKSDILNYKLYFVKKLSKKYDLNYIKNLNNLKFSIERLLKKNNKIIKLPKTNINILVKNFLRDNFF